MENKINYLKKERLVTKEFTQIPVINYDETYSPTVYMSTVCTILSEAVNVGLSFLHMELVTAF